MTCASAPLTSLQTLAAKWRVIGLLALAFARLLRRYEDGYKPGTAELAAQLELAARTAQILIVREIRETFEEHPPQSAADDKALAYLRLIATCLLALTNVAGNIRQRALSALGWMGANIRSGNRERFQGIAQSVPDIPFLDSG